MAGSLEAFKLFQESEKRRQARYEQRLKEQAALEQARQQTEQQTESIKGSAAKEGVSESEEHAVAKDVTQN